MENTLSVAKNFYDVFSDCYTDTLEARIQKMMYLVQRESLIRYDDVLFDEPFFGWKYGPVLKSVRMEFQKDVPFDDVDISISESSIELVAQVMEKYGFMGIWKLSGILHNEMSWKMSRYEMKNDGEPAIMGISAMRIDAKREIVRRQAEDNLLYSRTLL